MENNFNNHEHNVSNNNEENSYYVSNRNYHGQKKESKIKIITIALVSALVGSLLSLSTVYFFLPEILQHRGVFTGSNLQSIVIEPRHDVTIYTAVAQKAMPSVVGITTITTQTDRFFGTRRTPSLGTGVIVDERGYILTNSHVVGDGNADEVSVLFYDGSRLNAEVLWFDKTLDLAVIKVDGSGFISAELGDSDGLEVGEIAIAIGNPLGLNFERTLTQGVISGLNRSIATQTHTIDNLIQTDASINPGNSGGPLLNHKGQVIGINTAKIGGGEGLGFAIPINTAKPIVDQFIEKGEFTRVYLGIRGVNVSEFEAMTGSKLQAETGIYVFEIMENSVAEKHDLRAGDVIVGINSNKTNTMGDLIRELYKYRPGDEINVNILRNGRSETITVKFN